MEKEKVACGHELVVGERHCGPARRAGEPLDLPRRQRGIRIIVFGDGSNTYLGLLVFPRRRTGRAKRSSGASPHDEPVSE